MVTHAAESCELAPLRESPGPNHVTRTLVWPSGTYARQVAVLRRLIGRPVYIVELTYNGLAVGAVFHGEPRVLLDIVEFTRPDPSRGLYPHMLILDDGRGINLGRIARVTANRAFDPQRTDIVYQDRPLQQQLLYGKPRLSPRRIASIARQQLAALLGKPAARLLSEKG